MTERENKREKVLRNCIIESIILGQKIFFNIHQSHVGFQKVIMSDLLGNVKIAMLFSSVQGVELHNPFPKTFVFHF